MDLHKASVKQLRELLDKKEISAPELTAYFLDRISAQDHVLGSFITVCADHARQQAEAAQQLIDRGEAKALTGIPVAVKDNLCTKGIATTCGSKMLEGFLPPYNATAVQRLEDAGAVLLGKTNMDEFAMGGSTQSSYFGGAKNPWDTTRVPGGSSGGSAAGVAAGFVPVALGSDTGGSLRQPAAFCGVTGLKPTYGSVSRYGLVAFGSSLDQIGPLAKSAEDCALVMQAIAGYDPNDATLRREGCDYSLRAGSLAGLTIGVPAGFFAEDGTSPEVRAAVLAGLEAYKQLGCTVKEVSLPSLKYGAAVHYILASAEAASNMARYDGIKFGYRSKNSESYDDLVQNTRAEAFGDEVKRRILAGNHVLSKDSYERYYQKAVLLRQQLRQEYAAALEGCDFIITPTTPATAPRIGEGEGSPAALYGAGVYAASVNLAGLPALSTPCGYDGDGLPIGMSLVGRPFGEGVILSAAAAFESGFARREVSL